MVAGERETCSLILVHDVASGVARRSPGDEIDAATVDVVPVVEPDVWGSEGNIALERLQGKVGDRLRQIDCTGLEEQLCLHGIGAGPFVERLDRVPFLPADHDRRAIASLPTDGT